MGSCLSHDIVLITCVRAEQVHNEAGHLLRARPLLRTHSLRAMLLMEVASSSPSLPCPPKTPSTSAPSSSLLSQASPFAHTSPAAARAQSAMLRNCSPLQVRSRASARVQAAWMPAMTPLLLVPVPHHLPNDRAVTATPTSVAAPTDTAFQYVHVLRSAAAPRLTDAPPLRSPQTPLIPRISPTVTHLTTHRSSQCTPPLRASLFTPIPATSRTRPVLT